MMPSPDDAKQARHDATMRLFAAPPQASAPPPVLAITAALAERWYRRDLARRLRDPRACPACGERLCPEVGGRDVACVRA
jgi:hypothetical protein